jgi:putative ABC transport system permease protein
VRRFAILFALILLGLFVFELTPPGQALVQPWTALVADVSSAVIRFFDGDARAQGARGYSPPNGCALVIMGNSIRDAVVGLMDEQFGIVELQDVTVTFTEPASPRALHELSRLPGVTYAEPVRAVSAQVFHGQRSRRIPIQGLLPDARLSRVVDAGTGPVRLPENGLVISVSLAELLDAKPGDELIVEVLEGSRPVRRMRVVQVVNQHLGTWAYLRIGELQRLMGDAGLSGAYLQVEPSRADELYDRLKVTPPEDIAQYLQPEIKKR